MAPLPLNPAHTRLHASPAPAAHRVLSVATCLLGSRTRRPGCAARRDAARRSWRAAQGRATARRGRLPRFTHVCRAAPSPRPGPPRCSLVFLASTALYGVVAAVLLGTPKGARPPPAHEVRAPAAAGCCSARPPFRAGRASPRHAAAPGAALARRPSPPATLPPTLSPAAATAGLRPDRRPPRRDGGAHVCGRRGRGRGARRVPRLRARVRAAAELPRRRAAPAVGARAGAARRRWSCCAPAGAAAARACRHVALPPAGCGRPRALLGARGGLAEMACLGVAVGLARARAPRSPGAAGRWRSHPRGVDRRARAQIELPRVRRADPGSVDRQRTNQRARAGRGAAEDAPGRASKTGKRPRRRIGRSAYMMRGVRV
jgi:hypothetical protein